MSRSVFNKILVPVDGSKYALDAAEYAVELAKLAHAKVVALHVVHLPTYAFTYSGSEGVSPVSIPTLLPMSLTEDEKKTAKRIVDDVKELGVRGGVDVAAHVLERHPSVPDAIIQFAEESGVDLIIMGTKGKTAIQRFLLGSVTESVVHHAHCPVLVVR